ncbi:MAG: hypothetical protein KGR26_07995, partial [Cyanobacteria bacterium REEB65]|nr:hypothetical protein [Cyanobacteria bacterium REEB65]
SRSLVNAIWVGPAMPSGVGMAGNPGGQASHTGGGGAGAGGGRGGAGAGGAGPGAGTTSLGEVGFPAAPGSGAVLLEAAPAAGGTGERLLGGISGAGALPQAARVNAHAVQRKARLRSVVFRLIPHLTL